MGVAKGILIIFGLLVSYILAEEVMTLTEANFQDTINANQYVLVEFYAPWCGHCKKLAPEYEKAATSLKEYQPKVIIAKVDATAEEELAKKFEIKGFPTLKWFVNGEVSEYNGGRTESTIVSWIQKKTGPSVTPIASEVHLASLKSKADAVVVGFFNTESEASVYLKLAQNDDDTPYGICVQDKDLSCNIVAKTIGIENEKQFPKIVVLQNFDVGKVIYSGDVTNKDEVKKFISGNILPLIVPFTQTSAPKIFGGDLKNHLLIFIDDISSESTKSLLKGIRPAAEKFKGRSLFVTIPKSETRLIDFFGIKTTEFPTVRLVNMGEGGVKKFKMGKLDMSESAIVSFLDEYFAGKLKPDLKSEEIVPESEQGVVRVIVGKDFDQVVGQAGKDVFVEFYAPWCGHCKKLAPEYEKVGEYFKDNDNIIIAKMDSTANEVERIQISGFPTLKFFPADSDEIIDFDGERTKEGIIKFIEENAKSSK